MCLKIKEIGTTNKKPFYVYKILRQDIDNNIKSVLKSPYRKTIYRKGTKKLSANLGVLYINQYLGRGVIHAYLDEKYAKKVCYERLVLKILVNPEDVIATGINDIALKQLTISEKQYNKALLWKKSHKKSRVITDE